MSIPPSDIFIWNIILVPILLLFIRWAVQKLSWLAILIISLPTSWFLINALLWISPPDNPVAYTANMQLGWIFLLPLCGFCFLVEKLIFKVLRYTRTSSRIRFVGNVGSIVLGPVVLLFIGYGLFGRISSSAAVEISNQELRKQGKDPRTPESQKYNNGYWIIRYKDPIDWIRIDRNGKFWGGVG